MTVPRMCRPHGLSLVLVLLVIALATMAAFSMAALSTTALNFSAHHTYGQDAMYLGEAAIMRAIYSVHDNNTFGSAATDGVVVQPDPSDNSRRATITFDPNSALPFSSNNIAGNNFVGWGSAWIPAGTMRLVANGTSHGVSRKVDVLVSVPPFPYVLAVAGPFSSSGPLVVKSAKSMVDFADQQAGTGTGSADAMADMASNTSVSAYNPSYFGGDIVSPGTVSLASGSTLLGKIVPSDTELPDIDTTQFDPTSNPSATLLSGSIGTTQVTGIRYTSGDLTVSGDLSVSGALLYVKGNLTVTGSLSGRGAVIVRGSTTVGDGADLAATNLVALLSEGDVVLAGISRQYFQGLVYTHGNFTASNLTIAGTFVAQTNPSTGVSGAMSLTNATAVYVPDAANDVVYSQANPSATALLQYYSPGPAYDVAAYYSYSSVDTTSIMNAILNAMPLTNPSNYFIETGMRRMGDGTSHPYYMTGLPDVNDNTKLYYMQFDHVYLPPVSRFGQHALEVQVRSLQQDPTTNWYVMLPAQITYTSYTSFGLPQTLTAAQADAIAANYNTTSANMVGFALNRQQAAMAAANVELGVLSGSVQLANLSLNQFLRDTQPFRIMAWRDRP